MVHVVVEWPLMGKIRNYILKMLLYIYFYFSGMERRKPQRSTIKFTKNRTLTVYLPLSYLNGFYFVTSDLTKKKSKKKSQLFLKFPTYSPMSFDVLWANNIMLKGVSSCKTFWKDNPFYFLSNWTIPNSLLKTPSTRLFNI